MTPISQGSASVSAGVAEGAQARPVVAKSDSGHGADTSVFDGHLQALKALHAAVETSCQRLPDNEFGRNWRYMASRLNDAISDVECGDECPTVAVAWTLDGGMCAACLEPASCPNEDAAYEEAVGK